MLVLQKAGDGGYSSPLLHDRYQILEVGGVRKGSFTVIDLVKLDNSYLADFKAVFRHPTKGEGFGDPIVFTSIKEAEAFLEDIVSGKKSPTVSKNERRSAASTPKPKAEKKRSMASVTRELILAGEVSDDEIFKKVVEEFPTFRRTSVDWYREELKKKGLL
ncbi:hypothetical protein UFOVP1414_45 [uncultured Caudovirales phage]|uniref:Uncharacterized protein n=1 Tax=uncultured Caudovirales phage TaxID=2100421 RepID=A0A6J5M6G1_9CAUD|nr:hypothetical protein UFOVP442_32 [uncultured Caudovirales phage]CAB4211903.1 hypothetical protein UFOVP1414_45 [uncultured Caudovirales phage]